MDASGKLHFLNDGDPIIDDVENPSYLCILGRRSSSSSSSEGGGGGGDDDDDDARPSSLRAGGPRLCVISEVRAGTIRYCALSRDHHHRNHRTTRNNCGGEEEDYYEIRAKAIGTPLGTGGAYPCHVVSSNVGGGGGGGGGDGITDAERIMVSNYGDDEGGGVLSVFGFGNDGAIDPHPVVVAFGPGSNVDPHRQGMSHAHSTSVVAKQSSPSSSSPSLILCCADLGSDAIVQFSMSTEKSKDADDGGISSVLSFNETGRMSAPPGSGPRSITFNPIFGDVAIVSLEMTAQVWLVRRDAETGSLAALCEPVSLLPRNWPGESDGEDRFNHGRWASDAVWSPCGKFAYAAARLHNSISVFRFSTTVVGSGGGASSSSRSVGFEPLTFVQRVSTRGITPRCLCMSDCGKFILVAHQHSHDISSFRRNETDGSIAFVDRLDAPNAACVKLIRPDDIGF